MPPSTMLSKILKTLPPGSFMAKTDIESAFRILPVHPDDFSLLGFKWEDAYYYDTFLPMGCSSSCQIFETYSTALQWVAQNKLGCSQVFHILDVFSLLRILKNLPNNLLMPFSIFVRMSVCLFRRRRHFSLPQ